MGRVRRLAVVATLMLLIMPPLHAEDMPPFSPTFSVRAREFYKIAWLSDGYPGRRNADGSITAHPLYGIYAINDYIEQVTATPEGPEADRLRWAISRIAQAARNRMREFRGALVFWYHPADFPSALNDRRYYSGLTMSYWANAFHRVSEVSGLAGSASWARLAFDSLLIPESQGGVLEQTEHGPAIAEYPSKPRYMALNGWLSAIVSVHSYGTRAAVPEAVDLALRSATTVANMLPLFDVPSLRNSRYGIAGYQVARVVFSSQPRLVRSATFATPSEGSFPIVPRRGSRSTFWVYPEDVIKRTLGFTPRTNTFRSNLFISRIAYPRRSSFLMRVDVTRPTQVAVQVAVGRYAPRHSVPQAQHWVTIHRQSLPVGRSSVKAIVPWSTQHTVAYPTNFVKMLDGYPTNVYQIIHINRLRQLNEITGNPTFTTWADRWRGFVCNWATMDLYAGLRVSSGGAITPQQYCTRTAT